MKILFALHSFLPETIAGAEVVTYDLASGLKARGHDVLVLHRSVDEGLPDFSLHPHQVGPLSAVRLINNARVGSIERAYQYVEVEEAFLRVLGEFRPDIVHFEHTLHLSASLLALCRERGVPTAVTLHDHWFVCPTTNLVRVDGALCAGPAGGFSCFRCVARGVPGAGLIAATGERVPGLARPFLGMMARTARRIGLDREAREALALVQRPDSMRAALQNADIVLAPSQSLMDRLSASGVETGNFVRLSYGIASAPFAAVVRSASPTLRFGFIGTLLGHKGLHVLLEAMQTLPRERALLEVYGETSKPETVRRYYEKIRPLSAQENVHFKGPFDRSRTAEIFAAFDVLVMPSTCYENQPLTILEAFATKTPVVASNIGGMAELVEHEVNGLLFQVGDSADLAEKLLRLVEDPPQIARLAAGIRPVKSVEESVIEHEEIYRRLLDRRSSGQDEPSQRAYS